MGKSILTVFAITAGMMTTVAASEAMARQIGVVGLYEVGEQAAATLDEQKILSLGCQVRHKGVIAAEDGDIDIDTPNRFIFLACDGSILADPVKRGLLNKLGLKGNPLAILEGELTDMPTPPATGAVADRQYILKVSHYNNKDTDGRERDLGQLGQAAQSLPDTYITESFIGVNRALGMQTPDEVVVLYYDNPAQGGRFRKNNPDILEKVGDFNDSHLDDYIYYVGKAIR